MNFWQRWVYRLKKFYSRYTDKPIEVGYGVSFESVENMRIGQEIAQKPLELKQFEHSAVYVLNPEAGGFEMHGHVKGPKGPLVKLTHLQTGETYTFSPSSFSTLFIRQ